MATVEERVGTDGKTRYRARVRLRGHAPISATFDRKTDAAIWIQQTESDIRRGRHLQTVEAKRRTFAEMVDRYTDTVLAEKSKRAAQIQGPQLQWWKERLGPLLLSEVSPARIAEARDELGRGTTPKGKRRSPSTVVRYMAALSHCFSIAVREWQWLDSNPMGNLARPKEPRGRTRFLTDDERPRLLNACKESRNSHLYPIVVLALSTGMRRGEIENLSWDRIDLKRRVVTLMPEDTKNNETRVVPLVGHALDLIRELSAVRRIDTQLLFPSPYRTGTNPRPANIEKAWRLALERARIENFRFHDLRHTAASQLAMNGATLAEIAEVLGHKTLQMVKRYSHLTEAHTTKIVERMNTAVFGV